jgi:hypothetical protein
VNQLEKGTRPEVLLITVLKLQAGLDLPSIELLLTGAASFASKEFAGEVSADTT